MNEAQSTVNTIAPIKNVARFTELVETLVNRPPALPGFGVFSGAAGLGKTFSAIYAINNYRAHYVECDFTWTQKAFCEAVMVECGLLPPRTPLKKTIYRAVTEIGEHFADNPRRPLVIDEADFLVRRGLIEIVRAIYKHCASAGASIILIGEENMPNALKVWERVDSRILKSVKAQPLDGADIRLLAGLICPDLGIEKDALERLRKTAGGSARRAVSRLYGLRESARLHDWRTVTVENLTAEAA